MRRLSGLIGVLICANAFAAAPAVEFDAVNGRVESIRDLDIGGTLYHVSFDHAFGANLFVGDPAGANAAVDAIIDVLNPHDYFVDNGHPTQVAVFWVVTDPLGAPGVSACLSGYLPGTCQFEWTNVGDYFNNISEAAAAYFERVPTEVNIDVLPGDTANKVYPNKAGQLPVAVLSAADFDATQVDPATLKFASAEAGPVGAVVIADVDGLFGPDSIAKFKVEEAGIFCDDTEVSLSGETYAGEPIVGIDAIDASECQSGGCHAY